MIRECGGPAWLAILLSGLALATAAAALIVTLTVRARAAGLGVAIVALMLSLSIGVLGLLGKSWGLRKMEEALQGDGIGIDPSQMARIRAEGTQEASECVSVGLIFMLLPLLISGGALTVGVFKKQPQ